MAGLYGFTYPLPQENVKGDSWPSRLLTAMVFSDKKIIIVLPSIISQPCFPFAFSLSFCSPSPAPLFTVICLFLLFCVLCVVVGVCVCLYVLSISHVITQPPNTRLRWAATNNAEDQGEAWNCIRKASGLYVPLFSSQIASFLSSVFQL